MSRRLRRLAVPLLSVLLATTVAACGDDSGDGSGGSGGTLDGVTISGDPGSAPKVSWKGEMDAGKIETTVLEKGDGEKVSNGDVVLANIWVGNGFTEKKSFSTYDEGQKAEPVTVDDNLAPIFADALEGQTIGSRVAVTASAEEAFGPSGNPQLQIGNKDSVLVIVDLMEKQDVLDGPEGAKKPAPAWAPKVVEKDGAVSGLDFAGTPKPDGKLRSAALVQGTGATVTKGQTITVDYLGQVYGAKQPFDESYSKQPTSFPIGVGQVVSGWDKTLVGAKVGSRMILAIPPKEGYGPQGNSDAGIKGTDTLYFVVDILAAY